MTRQRPWVTLKLAMTLDGKLTPDGDPRGTITGPEAHVEGHRMRARHDAIMIGINTMLSDDPQLNVRHCPGATPLKVVLDSRFRTPNDCRMFATAVSEPVIVFTEESQTQRRGLKRVGVEVVSLPSSDHGLDLALVLQKLLSRGVNSVMVEGGGLLGTSFLERNLVDELVIFAAPWLAGGGVSAWPGSVTRRFNLVTSSITGGDVKMVLRPRHSDTKMDL